MTPLQGLLYVIGLMFLGWGILFTLIEWNGIKIWIMEQRWAESERVTK